MQTLCKKAKEICNNCFQRTEKYGFSCSHICLSNSYCGLILSIDDEIKTLERLQDIAINDFLNKEE